MEHKITISHECTWSRTIADKAKHFSLSGCAGRLAAMHEAHCSCLNDIATEHKFVDE